MGLFDSIIDFGDRYVDPIKSLTESIKQGKPLVVSDAPPTNMFDEEGYKEVVYNGLNYKVQIYLSNSGKFGSDVKMFHINPSSIVKLTIEDIFSEWADEGSMVFMYIPEKDADMAANGASNGGNNASTAISGAIETGKNISHYEFRGDGFDLLRVIISCESVPSENNNNNAVPTIAAENCKIKMRPEWTLSYMFSIYEVEDIDDLPNMDMQLSTYMKCLKVYFKDVRHHLLSTTNLEYSTAMPFSKAYTPDVSPGKLANQGTLYTGEAMSDILNATFSKYTNNEFRHVPIYDSEAATSSPTGSSKSIKNITWDKGKSELFYTSPAECTANDDLNYVYAHHVSEKYVGDQTDEIFDMCILHSRRGKAVPDYSTICLLPVGKFFELSTEGDKPGELQLEHFFVTSQTVDENQVGAKQKRSFKAPKTEATDTSDRDLKTFKYGQITSFSFVDMSPATNAHAFRSRPVYSFDFRNRTYDVDFQKNSILKARKVIGEAWIKKLYKQDSSDPEDLFLPVIHESKVETNNLNIFPVFSVNGDNSTVRQTNGLHYLMHCGLFHNACIAFTVFGLPYRETGCFIAIDRSDGGVDNDYNNKLYGQWFVIKVEHLFEAGIYYNRIYAVKVSRVKKRETIFEKTR
jgi:hypothetical protein